MTDLLGNIAWKADGKCYDLVHSTKDYVLWESFFADSIDDRQQAIEYCDGCEVQKQCLRFALETKQLWGVWGGRDEAEIRRDLWVNSNGTIGGRARKPRCPWCRSKPETISVVNPTTNQIECSACGFRWRSDTTQTALDSQ